MLRRVIMAVAFVAAGWALAGQPAVADYPPVPPEAPTTIVTPTTAAPKRVPPTTVPKKIVTPKAPRVVVVVRGAPVPPRRALVFTGTDTAIPLTALATASVGLGITLVCLSRLGWPPRRHHHRRRRLA
jgi:hypothetical protein